jgi:ubiquinone/menaquinone biosynthesis C-methylase UbiE
MEQIDHEAFRVDDRIRWERAAAGWMLRADPFAAATEPVTQWLVDAIDPQPGQTILELAAGLGDVGLAAAQRVAPTGRVLITDGADAMVAAAKERAEQRGITNIETRAMELEWIDLSAATVDSILCRWGYMLLADPEAALRESRRVLKPGGRLALAAWSRREENPWLGVMNEVLLARGLIKPVLAGVPGPFSFAEPGTVEELLAATGFADIEAGTLDFAMGAPSLDDWWEHHRNQSVTLSEVVQDLSPKEHYELRDAFDDAFAPFVDDEGVVTVPAQALVAMASA